MRRGLWKRPLIAAFGLAMLGWSDASVGDRSVVSRDPEALHADARGPRRRPLNGRNFPDGVLALTFDDGPDAGTLELAHYLHDARVSATFFVVGEWVDGISEEPGVGAVHDSGYRRLPVLGDLVALGHRLGNHTANHALLDSVAGQAAFTQLDKGQQAIDPFLSNELRLFRAPGGAWSRFAAGASAPAMGTVVGPIHWDIDAKDWEGSLYCRSAIPHAECEPGPAGPRTRAEVIARRYLALAESYRHGIVLMHDRVGDVGSRYALDVAHVLIPELEARGFVFASPVLSFGPLVPRSPRAAREVPDGARVTDEADIDGDGHADICALTDEGIDCSHSNASFVRWNSDLALKRRPTIDPHTFKLADVDGDRRADACVFEANGIVCATSTGTGFAKPRPWLIGTPPEGRKLELADLDGDGRADLCVQQKRKILCALSGGRAFGRLAPWADHAGAPHLGDINGDHRADACFTTADGIACALSNGRSFKAASIWSDEPLADIRLADINGDHRADLCAAGDGIVRCGMAP